MFSWLTNDWGSKLVALILAVGLWYYAVGEESVEVKQIIPLEIEVQSEQLSILKSSVKNVWVTFAAPRNLLTEMTSKEILAMHQIGSEVQTAGDYSFRLEPREIKLPSPQIRIVKIVPETIHVTVDEVIVQKMKINPNFFGEPAFGYKIQKDEIEIDPNAILVEGPKGQFEGLEAVYTEKIDLIGRIRSFRRTVHLDLPANVKALSEATVDIFIPIKEEFGEKTLEKVLVKVIQSPDQEVDVELKPRKISLVLKGSRLQLEKLKAESMLAYLDVTDLKKGRHEMQVQVVLPEDVSLKEEVQIFVNLGNKKD